MVTVGSGVFRADVLLAGRDEHMSKFTCERSTR